MSRISNTYTTRSAKQLQPPSSERRRPWAGQRNRAPPPRGALLLLPDVRHEVHDNCNVDDQNYDFRCRNMPAYFVDL